jgi:hypothetical protein
MAGLKVPTAALGGFSLLRPYMMGPARCSSRCRRRCSRATRWQWRSLGALYRQCYCDYTAVWLQEWYVATLGHRWVPSTSRGDAPDRAQLSS